MAALRSAVLPNHNGNFQAGIETTVFARGNGKHDQHRKQSAYCRIIAALANHQTNVPAGYPEKDTPVQGSKFILGSLIVLQISRQLYRFTICSWHGPQVSRMVRRAMPFKITQLQVKRSIIRTAIKACRASSVTCVAH